MMPNAFFVGFASAIRVCAELNAKISLLVSYRPLAVELLGLRPLVLAP